MCERNGEENGHAGLLLNEEENSRAYEKKVVGLCVCAHTALNIEKHYTNMVCVLLST